MILSNPKEYVLGFAFNAGKTHVVLIEKDRPEWQKGKSNGVGGKIEPEDECPRSAMVREFEEETGVTTKENDWHNYAVMDCDNDIMGGESRLHIFRYFGDEVFDCKTQESELIRVIPISMVYNFPLITKVNYMIPLALDSEVGFVNLNMLR